MQCNLADVVNIGGSQDLLSVREPPPRKRDKWRSSISGALGRVSITGGRERRKSKAVNLETVRSGSTASTSNEDTLPELQRRQSVFPPLPDWKSDPVDFLATFDKMAETTISRNLATAELDVAKERDAGPSPMLIAMVQFTTKIFSSLTRLQTLCIDSQTQEEFMERLDRGYALRYAPTQDTWEAISGYVISMIAAGWVKSETMSLKRLWVHGGAVGWGDVLMKEYLKVDRGGGGVLWTENGIGGEREKGGNETEKEEQTGLEMWKAKAARLESLSLKYDVGAYRKYFAEVETRWMGMVRDFVRDMPRLRSLEIAKQKRVDGTLHDRSGWGAVRLSNIAAHNGEDGEFLGNLQILRIGHVQVIDAADLQHCLEALGRERLEYFIMGSFDIETDDWPAAWKMLRDGCQFRLKQFILSGTRYKSTRGWWTANPRALHEEYTGGLLREVQEYVQGKSDDLSFPLSLTEDVGARAAFEQWRGRSDSSLSYDNAQ